jgi:uncharacterized BrkB/YihY/UPF0761 family membrane protein
MVDIRVDQRSVGRRRLSKLAAIAFLLSPLPLVASVVLVVVAVRILRQHGKGWEGLGDLMFVGMAGWFVLLGGTILAAITAAVGAAALWKIARRRHALRGRRLAWAAILISVAWTAVAWPWAFAVYFDSFESSSSAARPSP